MTLLPDLDSIPAFSALSDADDSGYLALGTVDEAQVERGIMCQASTCARGPTGRRPAVCGSLTSSITGVAGRLPWCELGRRIDGREGSVLMRARISAGRLPEYRVPNGSTGAVRSGNQIPGSGKLDASILLHAVSGLRASTRKS